MIVLYGDFIFVLRVLFEGIYLRLSLIFPGLARFYSEHYQPTYEKLFFDFHKQLREFGQYLLLEVQFPAIYVFYIRCVLENLRMAYNLRMIISWFPNFNPYGTIFELIVVPVDTVIRPFGWFFPKVWWFELSTWLPMFIIESGISLCIIIEKLANSLKLLDGTFKISF